MDKKEMMGAVEAILYVAGEAVEEEALRMAVETDMDTLQEALEGLAARYDYERSGIRLMRYGKSVQLSTRPDYAIYVEKLLQPVQRQNLTQAAMETLAVVAYKQPATRGDIEAVRGVKCDYSVQSLLNKGLIRESGRKETLGRPAMFVTTDAFLHHFGISSLDELPTIDFSIEPPAKEGEGIQESLAMDEMDAQLEDILAQEDLDDTVDGAFSAPAINLDLLSDETDDAPDAP